MTQIDAWGGGSKWSKNLSWIYLNRPNELFTVYRLRVIDMVQAAQPRSKHRYLHSSTVRTSKSLKDLDWSATSSMSSNAEP